MMVENAARLLCSGGKAALRRLQPPPDGGALTTKKKVVLYTAYEDAGRLWKLAPLADDTAGGYTFLGTVILRHHRGDHSGLQWLERG